MIHFKFNQFSQATCKAVALLFFFGISGTVLQAQSEIKNGTDTAFKKVTDATKQQVLKDFYVFWEVADENLLADSVSKNVVDHDRNPQFTGSDYAGMQYLANAFQSVSNLKHDFDLVEELDNGWVLMRWRASGKHTGELFGVPATNKTVYVNGHDIVRISEGKIVEVYHIETLFQLYAQLTSK